MGGPLETAFQDVVGSTAMLAAAAAILQGDLCLGFRV